jgi:tetratricopeptide (TPR) repeat protein
MNFRLLLSIAIITALTACGGAEERKAVYMEKAKSSIEAGDLDKARIELKNVLQIDPKDGEAYFQLGKVYEQQQEYRKAYGNYKKAEELSPDLLENHARLGRFYLLLMKDNVKAQEKVDLILSKDPDNNDGLLLKAALMLQNKDKAGAIEIAEGVVTRDPGYVEGATFLATLYVSDKKNQKAIALLDNALKDKPNNESLNKLLAAILVQDKQYKRAEVIYQDFLERNPDITASYNNLAAFYNQTDRKDKAEETLRASIENDPDDIKRQIILIKYIKETKGNEEAIAETNKLIARNTGKGKLRTTLAELYLLAGDKVAATDVLLKAIEDFSEEATGVESRVSLASIYINDKKYEKAKEVVDEAINISPNDPKVNMLRARLALNDKDMETATIALRIVTKETPENVDAYISLANIYQYEKNAEQFKSILNTAYENNRQNADGLLKLAQVLLPIDIALAEKSIDQYNKLKENDYKGLSIKTLILNQKKEFADAYAIATKLMEFHSDQPNGYLQTIYYHSQSGDKEKAIATLEKGYINTKNNRKILSLLTELQLSEKQFDIAENRIKAELNVAPDDEELKLLLTKVYLAENNTDAAEKVLKEVVGSNSVSEEPYLTLAQIQLNKGDKAGARTTLESGYSNANSKNKILLGLTKLQLADKQFDEAESRIKAELDITPEDDELSLLLANVYLANKKVDDAEDTLKEVVARDTTSEEVFLLLSKIYYSKKDMDSAEAVLVKGKNNIPSSQKIPLGLAALYESNDNYSALFGVYRELYESYPNNMVIVNNYASTLSDHGDGKADLQLAKTLSDKLLEAKQPVFLDTVGWVYYRLGDYQKAINYLNQVVEASPDVNVFNYHLGMAYKMSGDKTQARAYLEKSLADEKPFKERESADSALKDL